MVSQILEGCRRFFLEGGIAGAGHFVRDVNVKIERQRKTELQTGFHAGRIGFNGFVKCLAQLGEVLNVGQAFRNVVLVAMDATDEFGILPTRERPLQAAAETHRPRNARAAFNAATIGLVDAADEAQQGGFAGAIAPDQAYADLGGDGEGHPFQDPFSRTVVGLVALVDVVNDNHCITSLVAKRLCSASPRKMDTIANPYMYEMLRSGTAW